MTLLRAMVYSPEFQCSNASIMDGSCLVLRHPTCQSKARPRVTYPDIELDILICHRLDVETDRRDSRDRLIQLELVQDGYEYQQLRSHLR